MVSSRWPALYLAVAVSCHAPLSAAQDVPVDVAFDWDRDAAATFAACPSREALLEAVRIRAGAVTFVAHERDADVSVRGSLREVGAEWVARFSLHAGGASDPVAPESPEHRPLGVREIRVRRGSSCSPLRDTLGLVLSLMVDLARTRVEAARAAPTSTPTRPVTPAATAAGAVAPEPSSAPLSPPSAEAPWTFDARGSIVGVFYGLLPSSAGGPSAEVGLGTPWPLRFEVSGAVLFGARAEQGGRGADFRTWFVGASVCPLIELAPVVITGCVGGSAGEMLAVGFGSERNREARQELVLLHAELRAEVRLGPATVELGAFLMVPLTRDEFVFLDGGAPSLVFQPEPIAFGLRLGVGAGSW